MSREILGNSADKTAGIFFFAAAFWLFSFFTPSLLPASETYSEAVTHAQNNIDNNTNFIPNYPTTGNKLIIYIPEVGTSNFGLTYQTYDDTQYLVTRTFTKSKNSFNSSTQTLTGVGDTTIFGGATTDAAWVIAGNDTTKFLDGQGATAGNVTDIYERGLKTTMSFLCNITPRSII